MLRQTAWYLRSTTRWTCAAQSFCWSGLFTLLHHPRFFCAILLAPFGVGQRQSSISNKLKRISNPIGPIFGRKPNLFEPLQNFWEIMNHPQFLGFPMEKKYASGHHPPSILRPVCSYACFQEEYISPLNTPKVDQILSKSGSSLMTSCLAKDPYTLTMVSCNNPFISWYYPPKKWTAAVVGTIQILHISHVEQNLNSNNLWINSAMGARFSALKTLIQPGWNHAMFFQSEETKLEK